MNPVLSIKDEQRRYKSFIHTNPMGFIFNMQPASVKLLMENIGFDEIKNARILEVGCGQGYLVSHFLNLGAKHVTGTDVDQDIINSVPVGAFEVYINQGQSFELVVQKFENTSVNDVKIISQFIGINKLVHRLLDLFIENENVKIIAFMRPSTGKNEIDKRIEDICTKFNISQTRFNIKLSGSNEQRQAIVMKKLQQRSRTIDLTEDSSTEDDSDDGSTTTLGSFSDEATRNEIRVDAGRPIKPSKKKSLVIDLTRDSSSDDGSTKTLKSNQKTATQYSKKSKKSKKNHQIEDIET